MGTVEFNLQEHYNPLGPSVEYSTFDQNFDFQIPKKGT